MGRAKGGPSAIGVENFNHLGARRRGRPAAADRQVIAQRREEARQAVLSHGSPADKLAAGVDGAFEEACSAYASEVRSVFYDTAPETEPGAEAANAEAFARLQKLTDALSTELAARVEAEHGRTPDLARTALALPPRGQAETGSVRLQQMIAHDLDQAIRPGMAHDPDRELTPTLANGIARRSQVRQISRDLSTELKQRPDVLGKHLSEEELANISEQVPDHAQRDEPREVVDAVMDDVCALWVDSSLTTGLPAPADSDELDAWSERPDFSPTRFGRQLSEKVLKVMQREHNHQKNEESLARAKQYAEMAGGGL